MTKELIKTDCKQQTWRNWPIFPRYAVCSVAPLIWLWLWSFTPCDHLNTSCLHQLLQLSQHSESHIVKFQTLNNIPYFFCSFVEKEISAVRYCIIPWWTNKSVSNRFNIYYVLFSRQLLLIGGVDPVEDIHKFKLDGWGSMLQQSNVFSSVKFKTHFCGIFWNKFISILFYSTLPYPVLPYHTLLHSLPLHNNLLHSTSHHARPCHTLPHPARLHHVMLCPIV